MHTTPQNLPRPHAASCRRRAFALMAAVGAASGAAFAQSEEPAAGLEALLAEVLEAGALDGLRVPAVPPSASAAGQAGVGATGSGPGDLSGPSAAELVAQLTGEPSGPATQSGGQNGSQAGTRTGQAGAASAAARPLTDEDLSDFEGEVAVNAFDLVDLHVVNERLTAVLQLLSIQSQRNIVASNQVSARVTADLYGVTFYEALDAILHANGFGYIERGNFIFVYTQEELEAIRAESRERANRVIRLDYLNAVDAARFVSPLLSERGTITTPNQTADFIIPDDGPTGRDDYANEALIVIHDFPEHIERIEALIDEIDTRPAQVLVEATILQTSLNEANAFGVDFSLIADLEFSDFVSPLDAAENLISGIGADDTPTPGDDVGRALTSTVGNTGAEAGIRAGIIAEDIGIFIRALDEITDVTVISNPKVLTLNRQPARVLVGTRFGFLNTTTTDTATTQTVEFLDTGTQLHIRPFVTSEGLIRLELKPQVSTATPRTASTSTGLTVTIPDEDTTELVTNLLVRDGQTVVLGGLFTETTTATRRQVPVIGDIPLIGAAFRGHDDSTRRSEIIFLITPTIVNDDVLTLEGERATEYVEHARAGARQGLLPWSRERQVGQLLIEARELIARGETRRASLKVQRALALAPQSPDALALREILTGELIRWPDRSMLGDIFHGKASEIERGAAAEPGPGAGAEAAGRPARAADPLGVFGPVTAAPETE